MSIVRGLKMVSSRYLPGIKKCLRYYSQKIEDKKIKEMEAILDKG